MDSHNQNILEHLPETGAGQGGVSGEQYQASGAYMKQMHDRADIGLAFPSNNELLAQLGMACSTRTPAVMAAVERASAESYKLIPNDNGDPSSTGSAAYRYIMQKEGLDDYPQDRSSDLKKLSAAGANVIPALDAFVASQVKQDLVPAGNLNAIEAGYPPN